MPGDITLTSTTNTEAEIREALGLPAVPAATPEPVVAAESPAGAEAESTAAEASGDEKPAVEGTVDDAAASEAATTLSKRKGRFQTRLAELTREKYEHIRAKDEALSEVARLKAELSQRAPADAHVPEPSSQDGEVLEAVAEPTTPEPVDLPGTVPPKPQEEAFSTYTDFIDALTDWKADRRDEAQAKRDTENNRRHMAQVAEEAQRTKWNGTVKVAREQYPDFDKAIELSAAVPLSQAVRDLVVMSDVGASLLYYLAIHPAEAEKLSSMHPVKALAQLGRIEATLGVTESPEEMDNESAEPADESVLPPAKVPVSKAPKPLPRVGGGGGTSVNKSPDTMTHNEFKSWREANIRAAKGR
jgi:hypothetical protein